MKMLVNNDDDDDNNNNNNNNNCITLGLLWYNKNMYFLRVSGF